MSVRRDPPAPSTEARLQTLETRSMIHADSLSRLWDRVGSKMLVETGVPVYVEPSSAPLSNRMRKVLETGCAAMASDGTATDAPCAAVVMYGSLPNKIYFYTNKRSGQFGMLSKEVDDMTRTMMNNYKGFYGHMTGTMGYSNVYTYSYDGDMSMDELMGMMYAKKYYGAHGDNWYADMMSYGEKYGNAEYPYMSEGDMMMRIKMYG